MIDLVLRATTKAAILSLLAARGLIDAEGNPREGVQFCWWAGSGKLMTAKPVIGPDMTVTTPATYLAGFVMILRIATADDQISEGTEQWERSRIAKWIKTNGVLGTTSGIPHYEVSGVRLFRFADVQAKLQTLGVPGHEWMGGNHA